MEAAVFKDIHNKVIQQMELIKLQLAREEEEKRKLREINDS